MTATRQDWRNFPTWVDDRVFCAHFATGLTGAGEPSGHIVRCSRERGHKGAHRSEWTTP